ncbi:uncharacterized protein I206_101492 [Kwoniella pini CBS 10737]|uniref:Uncharacterized protein n=1 Tax=Kwoniella pini CBS 10737 TaxID=1296096 RepID=A0A1B9HWI1_9TREE|nr:uncharacterized protein I206_06535 [Kwoniella pini CBS 10737]OCF47632.1 hypothetical protein I206_06535 [Kwoniella pini CBS 10737]
MPPKAIYKVYQERIKPISLWHPQGGNHTMTDILETCSNYKEAKSYVERYFEEEIDRDRYWVEKDDEKAGHFEIKAELDEEDMRLWTIKEKPPPSSKSASTLTSNKQSKTTSTASPKELAIGSKGKAVQTAKKQTANTQKESKPSVNSPAMSINKSTPQVKPKATARKSMNHVDQSRSSDISGRHHETDLLEGREVHLVMEEHIYPRKRENRVTGIYESFGSARKAARSVVMEGGFGDSAMWNNYSMMDTDRVFEMKADGAKGVHHKFWVESHPVIAD